MGVDGLLQPCQVIWLTQLRKPERAVHIPSLVAVNRHPDPVSHSLSDHLDPAQVPLHIHAVLASHLKLNRGISFLHIPDHILYQLMILQEKGTASLISLGPILIGPHKSVKRFSLPLGQHVQHHQVQLPHFHRLLTLKSGVSYLPVKAVPPLIVAVLLPIQDHGKDVRNKPGSHCQVGACTFLVIQFNAALFRRKLSHSSGSVLKGLGQGYFMKMIVYGFCKFYFILKRKCKHPHCLPFICYLTCTLYIFPS